jgi:ubiquinone/menaquinone biosynthesis C-methylase UbiE
MTSDSETKTIGRYADVVTKSVLPSEVERLAALGRMFNPETWRVLEGAGLRDGMRCLELGAGSGTVATWLAYRIGAGEVVAVDAEIGMLAGRCAPNVTIVEADLTADVSPSVLGPRSFDLVHARFLLQSLPHPEAVIGRMVSWLAPGGVLVVGDSWFPPLYGTMSRALVKVHQAVKVLCERTGADWGWATRLSHALADHGLRQLGTSVAAPPLLAGSDHAEMLRLLFALCRPHLVANSLATEDEVDIATADLDKVDLSATPYLMITAWGRKDGAR